MNAAVASLAGLIAIGYGLWMAESHRRDTRLLFRGIAVAVAVFGALMFFGAITSYVPVAAHMTGTLVSRSEGSIVLRVRGEIERQGCQFDGARGFVMDADGVQHKATISWPDDPAPGSSRAMGTQDFGLWEWRFRAQDVVSVGAETAHECSWMSPKVRDRIEFEVR